MSHETDLNKWTVAQLKEELIQKNLDTTGRKAELIERLQAQMKGEPKSNKGDQENSGLTTSPAKGSSLPVSKLKTEQEKGSEPMETQNSNTEDTGTSSSSPTKADKSLTVDGGTPKPEENTKKNKDGNTTATIEDVKSEVDETKSPKKMSAADASTPAESAIVSGVTDKVTMSAENQEQIQSEAKTESQTTDVKPSEKSDEEATENESGVKNDTPPDEKKGSKRRGRKSRKRVKKKRTSNKTLPHETTVQKIDVSFKCKFKGMDRDELVQVWVESKKERKVVVYPLAVHDLSSTTVLECIDTCLDFFVRFHNESKELTEKNAWKGILTLDFKTRMDAINGVEALNAYSDELTVTHKPPVSISMEQVLFIAFIPEGIDECHLKAEFPESNRIVIPYKDDKRVNHAYIHFPDMDSMVKSLKDHKQTVMLGTRQEPLQVVRQKGQPISENLHKLLFGDNANRPKLPGMLSPTEYAAVTSELNFLTKAHHLMPSKNTPKALMKQKKIDELKKKLKINNKARRRAFKESQAAPADTKVNGSGGKKLSPRGALKGGVANRGDGAIRGGANRNNIPTRGAGAARGAAAIRGGVMRGGGGSRGGRGVRGGMASRGSGPVRGPMRGGQGFRGRTPFRGRGKPNMGQQGVPWQGSDASNFGGGYGFVGEEQAPDMSNYAGGFGSEDNYNTMNMGSRKPQMSRNRDDSAYPQASMNQGGNYRGSSQNKPHSLFSAGNVTDYNNQQSFGTSGGQSFYEDRTPSYDLAESRGFSDDDRSRMPQHGTPRFGMKAADDAGTASQTVSLLQKLSGMLGSSLSNRDQEFEDSSRMQQSRSYFDTSSTNLPESEYQPLAKRQKVQSLMEDYSYDRTAAMRSVAGLGGQQYSSQDSVEFSTSAPQSTAYDSSRLDARSRAVASYDMGSTMEGGYSSADQGGYGLGNSGGGYSVQGSGGFGSGSGRRKGRGGFAPRGGFR